MRAFPVRTCIQRDASELSSILSFTFTTLPLHYTPLGSPCSLLAALLTWLPFGWLAGVFGIHTSKFALLRPTRKKALSLSEENHWLSFSLSLILLFIFFLLTLAASNKKIIMIVIISSQCLNKQN